MEGTVSSKIAINSTKLSGIYQYISTNFWFGTPNSLPLEKLLGYEILATLTTAASLVLISIRFSSKKLTPPEIKFLNKAILSTVWFGPAAWLLVLFRYWGVVLLSARFIWILWALILLSVIVLLFRDLRSNLPASKQTYFSYQLKKKYFPKKKKRK